MAVVGGVLAAVVVALLTAVLFWPTLSPGDSAPSIRAHTTTKGSLVSYRCILYTCVHHCFLVST